MPQVTRFKLRAGSAVLVVFAAGAAAVIASSAGAGVNEDGPSVSTHIARANLDYGAVSTCVDAGKVFGIGLGQSARSAAAAGAFVDGSYEGAPNRQVESASLYAIQDVRVGHLNTLALALADRRLRCNGAEILAAAEPLLDDSTRAILHAGTPAKDGSGRMTSYAEWRELILTELGLAVNWTGA